MRMFRDTRILLALSIALLVILALASPLFGGEFVYVASAGGVWGYVIDTGSGALTSIPGAPTGGTFVFSVAVGPKSKFVYASAPGPSGTGQVFVHAINPHKWSTNRDSGIPVPGSKPGVQADGAPQRKYLYGVSGSSERKQGRDEFYRVHAAVKNP